MEQFWPADTALDGNEPLLAIKVQHAIHCSRVHDGGVGAELLSSHGMPSTHDADWYAVAPGLLDHGLNILHGVGPDDRVDPGPVQLRVDVVYLHGRWHTGAGRPQDERTGCD